MFLFVRFHDNDFHKSFINGLQRLWIDLKENNYENVKMYNIFIFLLNNDNALHKLIHRYIIAETLLAQAEHSTRGIARHIEKDKTRYKCDIDSGFGNYINLGEQILNSEKYLSHFKLHIEDNDLISKESNNGESFMLNINTGKVISF